MLSSANPQGPGLGSNLLRFVGPSLHYQGMNSTLWRFLASLTRAAGLAVMFWIGLAVVAAPVWATPDAPAPVIVPDNAIADGAGILGADRDSVHAAMANFTARTAIDVTVVTTNDAGGQTIQAYATAAAAKLGRDRGKAIVIGADMGTRKVGIYTTPDAQQVLPDNELDSVVDDILTPGFKDQRYGPAVIDALSAVTEYLHPSPDSSPPWGMYFLGAMGFGASLMGIGYVSDRRRRRNALRHRRRQLEPLESTLSTLADPKDRYRYAFSKTGVSVEEWNLIFPQWYCASGMYSASSTPSHYGSTNSTSTGGSSSYGGFTGGGGQHRKLLTRVLR